MQAMAETDQKRLGDYMASLRRHWIAFLLTFLVVVALSVVYLMYAPKTYESTAAVLVTPTTTNAASAVDKTGTTSAASTTINLDTEAQLVTASTTLDAVAQKLHLSATDEANLINQVSVTVPPSTEILDIAYDASTPGAAQAGAKAFAEAYLAQRATGAQNMLTDGEKALQSQIDPLNAQLQQLVQAAAGLSPTSVDASRNFAQQTAVNSQLTNLQGQLAQLKATQVTPGEIVSQAALPTDPSNPNTLITLAAGVVLGLLAGIGAAAWRSRRDDRVRSGEDMYRQTRVPALAVLPSAVGSDIHSPLSADGRGYARLRNLVTTGLAATPHKVLLVAGVERASGPVAANLAVALARADEQVFLVCGDVFRSTAADLLGKEPAEGLAEVLSGDRAVEDVVRSPEGLPNLKVLAPGGDAARADALLQTRTPRRLIDQLIATGAYIVLEAPPTRESADAQTLAHVASLAVLVVDPGHTGAQDILDACAQLESVHTPVLGAVLARFGRGASSARSTRRTPEPALKVPSETVPTETVPARGSSLTGRKQAAEDAVPSVPAHKDTVSLPLPVSTSSRPALVPPTSRDDAGR